MIKVILVIRASDTILVHRTVLRGIRIVPIDLLCEGKCLAESRES